MRTWAGEVLEGVAGTATHVMFAREASDNRGWQAGLCMWLLHCPGQSALWSDFYLGVVHLREIEGERPAVLRLEGATHEVMLLALDPAVPLTAETLGDQPLPYLTPLNVEEQFIVPSDDAAIELLRLCAKAVVDGLLWAEPPLRGQREPWATCVSETAAHFRGEHDAGLQS